MDRALWRGVILTITDNDFHGDHISIMSMIAIFAGIKKKCSAFFHYSGTM